MKYEPQDFYDPATERTFEWNEELACSLVGKTVIIGITENDQTGAFVRKYQIYGTIALVDGERGISVAIDGTDPTEYCVLPPAPFCFVPAERGTYRLRSSGKVIENPDYVSTWTATLPEPGTPRQPADEWQVEPTWDEARAAALIGKTVVIGITVLDESGSQTQTWHGFGNVSRVSAISGIEVELMGVCAGSSYLLPPAPMAFLPAQPGVHAVPGTPDTVENPDFTITMVMRRRGPSAESGFTYSFPDLEGC